MEMSTDRLPAHHRAFRVLDAMILTAATALGCSAMRWVDHATEGQISWPNLLECDSSLLQEYSGANWAELVVAAVALVFGHLGLAMPFLAAWTLALIPIRLIGPRPRWRRLSRQPGMMAACASGLAVGLLALQVVIDAAFQAWGFNPILFDLESLVFLVPEVLGLAVLVSWMTLLIGRRWRAEPTWIDRLGRVAGIYWIAAALSMPMLAAAWNYVNTSQCMPARIINPLRAPEERIEPAVLPEDVFAR